MRNKTSEAMVGILLGIESSKLKMHGHFPLGKHVIEAL